MQGVWAKAGVFTLVVLMMGLGLPSVAVGAEDSAVADTVSGDSLRLLDDKDGDLDEDSRKRETAKFIIVGFGPGSLRNIETDGIAYDFYGGRLWEVNPYAAIQAILNVLTDFDQAALIEAGAGLRGYLLDRDVSPYSGVDFSFGYLRGNERNTIGFTGGLSIGAQLFRFSDTQISAGARIHAMFRRVENSDGEDRIPYGYALRVGVLF